LEGLKLICHSLACERNKKRRKNKKKAKQKPLQLTFMGRGVWGWGGGGGGGGGGKEAGWSSLSAKRNQKASQYFLRNAKRVILITLVGVGGGRKKSPVALPIVVMIKGKGCEGDVPPVINSS